MSRALPGEGRHPGLARNMSAPPRSTFSFQPYGSRTSTPPDVARPVGLREIARASLGGLIAVQAPVRARRIQALSEKVNHLAHRHDPGTPPVRAELHGEIVAGLAAVAAHLLGEPVPCPDPPTSENLSDLLARVALRLTPPALPAMGVVERLGSQDVLACPAGLEPLLAGFWLLTHVNGHSFDRDGQPMLPTEPFTNSIHVLYAY